MFRTYCCETRCGFHPLSVVFSWLVCSSLELGDLYVQHTLTYCRTFQESVLARRVLVFTAEEAFFYCLEGLLAESVYRGDNQYRALPIRNSQGIKLCGSLYQPRTGTNLLMIWNIVGEYRSVFMPLLRSYIN
jgi:hypothetical protein